MEETWGGRLVVHERGSKSSAGEEAEEGDAEGSLRKGVGEGWGVVVGWKREKDNAGSCARTERCPTERERLRKANGAEARGGGS